jgi:hypothetical protein
MRAPSLMTPLRRAVPVALAALLLAGPAAAMDAPGASGRAQSWAELQTARCMGAIVAAERQHATLPGLLAAIARTESGRPIPPLPGVQPWPWAVNADGAAMYFDSKQAAVAWTRNALDRGARQVDVGCMQINLQAHARSFATLDQAFEPSSNADYAARFLLQLRSDAAGNWYEATGWYHSRTPFRAADYRARVAAIAEGRIPATSLGVPLYLRAIQQGSLRIQLANGGVLRINVNRQPGRRRPMSACKAAAILGDYMPRNARQSCGQAGAGQAGTAG